MLQPIKALILPTRTFKNFGHKRQRIPLITTLWHGFLTFTFIGLSLEWDVISKFMFGEKNFDQEIQDNISNRIDDKHT